MTVLSCDCVHKPNDAGSLGVISFILEWVLLMMASARSFVQPVIERISLMVMLGMFAISQRMALGLFCRLEIPVYMCFLMVILIEGSRLYERISNDSDGFFSHFSMDSLVVSLHITGLFS